MAARLVLVAIALLAGACGTGADHQRAPIGSACQKDGDCGTAPYKCLLKTSVNGADVDYPDGYCTLPCVQAALSTTCPSDSICVIGECRRLCASPSDCRVAEKYACVPKDTNGASSTFCDLPAAL
jgi:hypothetical protein